MSRPSNDPRSSVAVGGGRKKKRGGLLWLVLGALLLLLLLALLLGSCGDDDDESAAGTSTSTPTAAAPAETTPGDAGTAAEDDAATAPEAPAGDGGTLTARSQSLLGGDAPTIADQVGQVATGTGLKVLSVSDSGFFVGTDETDRQFVEYGGEVGGNEVDEELPAVGDSVDLTGPVRPAPEDPARTLKLDEAAAAAVSERGAYVNADTVTPAA